MLITVSRKPWDVHGMGRIPSLPDTRNWPVGPVLKATQLAAAKARLLRLLWYGDQGDRPFCVGFTGEGWQRTTPSLRGRATLDAVGYYNGAQNYDEWPGVGYEGSSIHGLMKFMVAHPDNDVTAYRWATNTQEILTWLRSPQASPVCIGVSWFGDMFTPNTRGIITPTGFDAGGHALLIIGFRYVKGQLYFILHNSWGRNWGPLGGRALISEEHMQFLLDLHGEAAVSTKFVDAA